ncbi:23S rRNA (cytidine1920-2'-O)/16S rRNA (cytidine1409-2'-O)-methyltransferase [Geosporobacter subterraneus DSM 17957]|uniref:23S rRNA (Cytidine1920-2'-O)/16S rRNA (Cytidine1409-2'-O)-methyltransferase n=1 Tax=Geosporobacter subterraneus DSM 17957 TaxID=1121919 RepID=A0A1M6C4F9_9FIRM|nr:TlyA family RNA methyltransferase [Geosporobacter subterraneus]SHI55832.1 23S rRNA (cytidine1920-2'-O)/16S rRNA (cytidine1409-2'-O)-methyltransferase [Geosporobacter subterraneus DSM 17957]
MGEKERIDVLLVEKGFFDSREKARTSIMAGLVFVDQHRVDKSGTKVNKDSNIMVKGNAMPYVSRGGLKLEKAIQSFQLVLQDKTAMDIGASTGGFTDCMLKNGAKKVYAIDVGYGQLAWELRQDERVVSMERTNIRHVSKDVFQEEIDFASIDVSFISLRLVLPVVKGLIRSGGEIVALIKPQFEAGREKVGKKGVVRDKHVHLEVIRQVVNFAINLGLQIKGISFSPIKGPEGNIEYLSYFLNQAPDDNQHMPEEELQKIVEQAHRSL